jgi:hypothetical protein
LTMLRFAGIMLLFFVLLLSAFRDGRSEFLLSSRLLVLGLDGLLPSLIES